MHRGLFSSTAHHPDSPPRPVLNPRFDPSHNHQPTFETSLQTFNQSRKLSTSANDADGEDAPFSTDSSKRTLRTIPGVFCPIALSMLAISIFMRFGFVLAHAGVFQTLLQLGLCFVILFCTLLSICSLATNGAIEGGGVYHMISRTLGPEFGGSIGVLFFLANIIGNGQSVVALVETLVNSFGPGSQADFFRHTHWWRFLYGTVINLTSMITCLLGSSLFSIAAFFIFILVCFVYLMVVISFFIRSPHLVLIPKVNTYAYTQETLLYNRTDSLYGHYTGFSSATMRENLFANYTIDYTTGDPMDFITVFGILFSSIIGLLAGTNNVMSGETKGPSRRIPNGSIAAILFVFFIYITETLLIAATTGRDTLLNNYLFLQEINIWKPFVIIGIISAVFSACLSGMIGASRILLALSTDEIFGPVLRWVRKGTTRSGNPVVAVLFTFILVEVTLLIGSMNKIARIVTIFFLLAYLAVNLSCLALDLASAPNFRPSFKYFSWHTALIGATGSLVMCFLVSPVFASIAIGILIGLIAMLHLRDFPRASWGSISQALIFHQVRKYLLLLDPRKEHVKFWRPQILLLVANPRSSISLIDFVNDMKKGGLFILAHVKTDSINDRLTDTCTQEYPDWVSLIDHMKIKAFVDMTSATTIRDGVTQIIRLSGLGGLRPNTVILGFYDETTPEDALRSRQFYRRGWLKSHLSPSQQPIDRSNETIPTSPSSTPMDGSSIFHFPELRQEKQLDIQSYVQIIRDALHLNKSVCLARNFPRLQKDNIQSNKEKVFVDIWPINFISSEISTQFDVTCLYMLQLATILSMVKPWKTRAVLRVFLCINPSNDNVLHREHLLNELLAQLRIKAQTRIIAWNNPVQPQATSVTVSASSNSFVDVDDEYIRTVNELLRQQCDNTACLYLYLPRPPLEATLSERYIRVLDILSKDLPPIMFVHGVSAVTCTQL